MNKMMAKVAFLSIPFSICATDFELGCCVFAESSQGVMLLK